MISPQRRRVRAYFGLLPDANFDGESIRAFLIELHRAPGVPPIALIWDRLAAHIGEPVATGGARVPENRFASVFR